ncbi:MAG TPA: hypothetical protein VK721_15190 [Solirubrobacteraceae bacterium]|jgi:hypothetical protein|nr:hypothetical protein [Solirubrobacteraceae bacterium]
MSIGTPGTAVRMLTVALLSLLVSAIVSTSASAKVVHHVEASFTGAQAPDGPLGLSLLSDAIDDSGGLSQGDVYVLEADNETLGQGVVDKFGKTGVYAGVQLTGDEQGAFEFGPFGSGLAVDSSLSLNSGDVYVADTGRHVVDRFTENGTFVCQIAGAETEADDPSATECDAAGSGLSGAIEPAGLAVDSSGEVYVADNADAVIDELGPEGRLLRTIESEEHLSHEMTTIALDASGDLYVNNFAGSVVELGAASAEFVQDLGSFTFGVAVDRTSIPNRVYVDEGQAIQEYEPSGTLRSSVTLPGTFWPGLAVDETTHGLYAASAQFVGGTPEGVDIVGPGEIVPNVATEPATGVDMTTATLNGVVEPDAVDGGGNVTSCAFEYVTETQFQEHPGNHYEGAATAACEPATPYGASQDVTAKVTLLPSTTYHFRVQAADAEGANNGEGEAKPEAALTTSGAPAVVSESATATTRSATLSARIDPFGLATTCEAQVVGEAEFARSGYANATTFACPQALQAGFAAESVSIVVNGLSVDTTYHYRFIAGNAAGPTNGADETFATFGLQSFTMETLGPGGKIGPQGYEGPSYTQAGGHPYVLRTSFALSTSGGGAEANVKDTETQLPAGLIGNPTAVARCTREQLTYQQCPGAAQVGIITLRLSHGAFEHEPLYNLVPPEGVPAEFGVRFNTYTNVYIDSNVRTGGDYGVTARVTEASAAAGVVGATVELWGVPAAESHDAQRACPVPGFSKEQAPCSAGVAPTPFVREPTSCAGQLHASMSVDSWQDPGAFVSRTTTMPALTGCELPDFTPSLSLAPSTSEADSPSGLALELKLPQDQGPEGVGESDLRSSTVALPAGMSANPSAAAGLQACSPAQIGLDDDSEPSCPEASKIGTVEIETPLLSQIVEGSVYVAEQSNNPFGSLLAIYLVADADGALVKLAGHVEANQETGQLTTSFENLPQLPFSELRLHLFGGPRGALATPEACGGYAAASAWGPWSAIAPVSLASPFSISSGCVVGFRPSFVAGVSNTQAGSYSPLVLSFSRADDEQPPSGLSVTLPPGLLARIAGVPLCPEAEANAGDCPEASQIGTVLAGSGAGPSPISLPGRIYLTGPYKGAPYGESVVVPAIAGPYNLGDVIVRGAIRIDPATAQATVVSDSFPTILQGIPVRLRSVQVTIDRAQFTFAPTSCEHLSVTGTLLSTGGLTDAVSSPIQASGCGELSFHPTFAAAVKGPGTKLDGVGFEVRVSARQGPVSPGGHTEANIRKVDTALPLKLPSRLETLQRACTEQQFAANPAACPAASRVGTALVRTPVLPDPLSGPVYLVSHAAEAFPDLVIVLQGDNVTITLTGHTQIKHGITYSRFESIPDAPVSSFQLTLPAGRYSILAGNELCAPTDTIKLHKRITRRVHGRTIHTTRTITQHVPAPLEMPTEIVGQNDLVITQTTRVALSGCQKAGSAAAHPRKNRR